jgi:hypothetical protein
MARCRDGRAKRAGVTEVDNRATIDPNVYATT